MKKILILIIAFVCVSCIKPESIQYVKEDRPNMPKTNDVNVQLLDIIIIDSCEYLSYELYNKTGLLTHKGNCKNCKKK